MNLIVKWTSLWDTGVSAQRLDLFRIFFAGACLSLVSRIIPYQAFDIPHCMWNPPGIAKFILFKPLNFTEIKTIGILFKVSLVFLGLGIFSRTFAAVCGTLAILLLGTYHAAYYFNTSGNSLVIVFFILAVAPSLGSTYSIDSLWCVEKSFLESERIWPQRLIQFLFFSLFFAAGVSKIKAENNWYDANNLVAILKWTRENYGTGVAQPIRDELHHFLISSPQLLHYIGEGVLLTELSAPIFFFFNRLRPYGAALFAGLHLGIVLTMYFNYILILPLYLIFVPLEKIFKLKKQTL